MVDGLYLRANGALPCWCGPGEAVVHATLAPGAIPPGVQDLPALQAVRRAFAEGRLPSPGICEGCQVLGEVPRRVLTPRQRRLRELHLEPSWLCNLGCAMCPPGNRERRAARAGPHHMEPALLDALIASLEAGGVRQIETVRFEGKGDPLLNPELERLVARARAAWPRSFLVLTTNGSFKPRPGLARCGLDHVDISADGFTQESYGRYRVRGDLERVKRFAEDLAARGVDVGWKYILMPWNDGEAEISRCLEWCRRRGIVLELRLTHSVERSPRWDAERLGAWVDGREGVIARQTLARAAGG
jgi:molybdenum cofactor biosynthesis enzyme MoaA